MAKHSKRYTPKFKFQVVLEAIKDNRADAETARAFGVHPVTLSKWKQHFLERGAEIFSAPEVIRQYEIADLERLWGQK